jgi:hypothetical protein
MTDTVRDACRPCTARCKRTAGRMASFGADSAAHAIGGPHFVLECGKPTRS